MTVSIIGRDNNSGLTKDRDILLGIIPNSQFRSIDQFHPPEPGVSIFTEIIDVRYLNDYNILIPNQEWFFRGWIKELKKFQAIWVKTHLAYQIFSSMHPNVKYIGFTSIDMYREVEKKHICFHAQGKSSDKGTEFLMKWDKELPYINVLSHKLSISRPNLRTWRNRLPQDEYEILANESLIHVCPSTMEGFGHYINEAKSMGNVVVTTDSAPMNELITDKRFLCKVVSADQKDSCLGTWTRTNSEEINNTVKGILDLDLIEIGKQNRTEFLKQDADFKERLKYELSKI
jgi:glycosyltransferase involved in cell wall biosynthesis